MPTASSQIEPGKVANDRESKSSATQLAHFGVRLAKFTHRVSSDGATDFSSNYDLPSSSVVLSVSFEVTEAYDGTAVDAEIQAGGSAISTAFSVASAVKYHEPVATGAQTASGEISINFNATDSTAGEMVVAVAYIDLTELS